MKMSRNHTVVQIPSTTVIIPKNIDLVPRMVDCKGTSNITHVPCCELQVTHHSRTRSYGFGGMFVSVVTLHITQLLQCTFMNPS